ncbi:MAG: hypothetical protein LH474_03400 [Chamaesiphon sp.]|nr:hypothetical protein [Chamaesiphon sp.]
MSKLSNSSLAHSKQYPFDKNTLVVAIAAVAFSAIASTGMICLYKIHPWAGYGAIASTAIIYGVLAGLLSEIFDTRARQLELAQAETSELQTKFAWEIRQAHEQIDQARLDKLQIESIVAATRQELTETIVRLATATQELIEAQTNADLARSKVAEIDQRLAETIQEKLKAQENARLAQARVDEIAHRLAETIQEKLKAEEEARLAQAKVAQTDREKLKAEADIRLAHAKATDISHRLAAKIQEKLKAEEDVRLAQAKVAETVQRLVATTQEKNEAQTVALSAQAKVTEITQKLAATTQEKYEAEKNIEDLCQSIDIEYISYEKLQRENTELKLTIDELEKSEIDDNNITENTSIQCLTVCDALMFARTNFMILNIWNNAFTTAATVDRYLPKKVYTVLEILAEVGDLYFQGSIGNSIPELLRQRGVPCSRESMSTMGKYGYERDFPYTGKKTQRMDLHLKIGRKMRIYFDVDNENRQISIGYCGQHLHTVTG